MKFNIRPETFISHFVPGFTILVFSFSLIYDWNIIHIFTAIKQKAEFIIFIGFGILIISFVFGLILDAIRDIAESLFDKIPKFKVNWDFFYNETSEKQNKLERFYFPWYVFNANTMFGILISIIICTIYHHYYSNTDQTFKYGIIVGSIAFFILLVDAIILRIEIIKHTNEFSLNDQKPDFKVYTRIKRSPIHGIGVFAVRDIEAETLIFLENCDVIKHSGKE
jgi:hypothetical protein